MESRMLPIGIDDFRKLRENNFYYIDKTGLIGELLHGWGEVNLFTRPRRFGKTLNMSMLKSFFEIGTDPKLFEGLAIAGETELCEAYMGRFPVVFLSLKDIEGLTYKEAERELAMVITQEALRLRVLLNSSRLTDAEKRSYHALLDGDFSEISLTSSLKKLMSLLYNHYGKKVILLIDEYDVPLDKAYQNGYYGEMLNLIRFMFQSALKTNDSLYFAVLTGCLRVSKESIFTGLNNLNVHSIADVRFDEYFGFTRKEVQILLAAYGLEEYQHIFKEWYDGYHFGEQDVYCPWDVLNYAYDLLGSPKAQPKTYWLNTSGNDLIRRLIEKADTGTAQMEIENLINGQTIRKELNDQLTHAEVEKSMKNLWSLLFMTGYLTITAAPVGNVYELAIPNQEVSQIFKQQVLQWFHDRVELDTGLTELYTAFETGDAQKVEQLLNRKLLDTISYYDEYESFYHGFLLALLSACASWYAVSNIESGTGRCDIRVERKDRTIGFVAEVKYTRDEQRLETEARSALRQIMDRDYIAPLKRYRIRDIWMYGIAFCEKECRVVAKRDEKMPVARHHA